MTAPATVRGALQVQYQDGEGDWQDFGPPQDLGSLKRTRRFALGPRRGVTAQHWRVVRIGEVDLEAAVIAADALRFWRETSELSPVRLWSFAFDEDQQRYVMVFTDQNVEVHHLGQTRVAAISTPYTADQVRAVTRCQALDTLLTFNPDVAPQRVTRQGAHDQWDCRAAVFKNVPLFDYLGTRLGGENEIQQLRFVDYDNGDTFNITLEGETTEPIQYYNDDSAMCAALVEALEALPNVGPGGVSATPEGDNVFSVEFIGDNANDDIGEMAPVTLNSNIGVVICSTTNQGEEGGEPIFSATRGYPACGTFYQQRLWMGGLRARPQTLLSSRVGDFFNLRTKGAAADAAISVDVDTDVAMTFRALFPGRNLQAFSSEIEFYFPTEPIVAPPAVKAATRFGIASNIPPVEGGGGTLFVTKGGEGLAAYGYDDTIASYDTQHLSWMAAHRVTGIIGLALRPMRSTAKPDLALMAREDGGLTVMSALRAQDVIGFNGWTTNGRFLDCVADAAGELFVAVARTIGDDEEEIFLEQLDEGAMLDAQVKAAGPLSTLTGLGHLEGQTITLYVDGADGGDHVVTDGAVLLPTPALREVCGGLHFQPRGVSLPLVMTTDPRAGAASNVRACEIAFRLGPTSNLKAGLAGGRMWPLKLKRRPQEVLDEGPGENAFEGWTRLQAVPGFRPECQVEWVQARPGPLEILELVVTVES